MDISKLKDFLEKNNEPPFRLRQIVKNYYSGRYSSFDQMTDISKDLRQKLSTEVKFLSVKEVKTQIDGKTQKALLELEDGSKIESVLMDYDDWLTVCVSSQVGCPLGCKFCATGKMGFIRNLSSEEIVDQILFWNQKIFPKYVGRIVFMGMGEPFLNWDNLLESIKIINSPDALNIGSRKISISTAGLTDKIKDFTDLNSQINLAVSLHSANQSLRQKIMPIATKYSISQIKSACDYYTQKTNRQIFFEYALIKGTNDTPDDIKLISSLIKSNRLFYLNIIPLNQVDGGLTPSDKSSFNNFITGLEKNHVNFSVRHSFGQSVNAACGQLSASLKLDKLSNL
jgi:23S rRNA (adenine2503-C2)-methyltransferase